MVGVLVDEDVVEVELVGVLLLVVVLDVDFVEIVLDTRQVAKLHQGVPSSIYGNWWRAHPPTTRYVLHPYGQPFTTPKTSNFAG